MQKIYQKQEHTSSYYAATVNETTAYPALQDGESADVCVVGAGFTGVSTALALAERGYSVALVEGNRVGWGASGRNGGQLIHGISGLERIRKKHGAGVADLLWDIKWRGNDIIRQRIAKYGIDCDLKDGYAEVATKPGQTEWFAEYVEEREQHGAETTWEIWDREQTRELLGTDAFHGTFVCFRDGHLHPLNLCIGEARAAHELGVRIFEQSPVTGIDHGERPRVRTTDGYVDADAVVLAGNAYSQFEPKHLANLVFPAGSYIIGTEPLSDDLAQEINARDVAVCDLNEVVDYYRLSADKRLLYGGACNYSGRDPASIKDFILPRMLKVYPQMKDVRIDYEWGGKIGIVLNRIPTVGRINDNVYYCQGYSGHGVNVTHLAGQILADAIGGTLERFDLFADVKPWIVPFAHTLSTPMVALGVLYYQIRDRL